MCCINLLGKHVSGKTVFSSNQSETSSDGSMNVKLEIVMFLFTTTQIALINTSLDRPNRCLLRTIGALMSKRHWWLFWITFYDDWASKNENIVEKVFFQQQKDDAPTPWKWRSISFYVENQKLACLEVTQVPHTERVPGLCKNDQNFNPDLETYSILQCGQATVKKITCKLMRFTEKNKIRTRELYLFGTGLVPLSPVLRHIIFLWNKKFKKCRRFTRAI